MQNESISEDRLLLIERFARQFESTAQTRIAGRILGYMFTSDEPHVSLSTLARDLSVSKASISTNARLLIVKRFLTEAPVPGSRETHYAVVPDGPRQALEAAVAASAAAVALAEEGLALMKGRVTPGVLALQSMHETYGALHTMIRRLVGASAGRGRKADRA